jgi:hypothetical protein
MLILKQSTAVDVLIGPFLDTTDAATAETGESPSVKLSKNGQALAAKNDATTPVHDADGYYNCELDATDTNTVGTLVLSVAKSATALPVRHEFQVVEEAVYDSMFGSGAGGVPTATENADALLDRDMSAVTVNNTRSPINALRAIRNKVSISGGTMTVTEEDDATSAWTASVTSDSAADPITEIDPA